MLTVNSEQEMSSQQEDLNSQGPNTSTAARSVNSPTDLNAVASARRFSPVEVHRPIVLNSLPKCGTVLARNILMHFVGPDAMHIRTLEPNDVVNFQTSEDLFPGNKPTAFVTHFPLYPQTAGFVRSLDSHRMTVLVRNPIDNCYSLARHLSRSGMRSENPFSRYFIDNKCAFEEVVYYCVRGYSFNGTLIEGVRDRYSLYLAWTAQGAALLRYEDLMHAIQNLDSKDARNYVEKMLNDFGISVPEDWKERIVAASRTELSWTATHSRGQRPNEAAIARLLQIEAPNLLAALGYD